MKPADRQRRPRIAWLDAARGIGIVLVVIGHIERGLVGAGIATAPGWGLFDAALYTFHMPLFMLLAGINVPDTLRRGTGRFVADKLRSVAYPYLLWSLLQGGVLVVLSRFVNNGASWGDLARIGWQPMSQFWFLYALMAYLLLAAITGARPLVLLPVAIAALVAGFPMDGEGILHRLSYYLVFFAIGVSLAGPIKGWQARRPLLSALALALGWLAALQIVPRGGSAPHMTVYALPCALLGTACVMNLAAGLGGVAQRVFVRLGEWSMSIYVMHILAGAGVRIAMARIGLQVPAIAYLAAGVAGGIALPIVAHLVLERLGLLPLFGLGKRSRRPAGVLPDRVTGEFGAPAT